MKKLISSLSLLSITVVCRGAELQEVASFPDQQVTGVGVSTKSGRIFVNFPYWSDDHGISVAEIVDGKPKPFPNEEWNKPGAPASHFVCVQSVVVDDQDNLWVIDPAAPKTKEIVKGGPKLVKVDLKTNRVVKTIPFGEDVAPERSYLNDVRIDTNKNIAFITDSGLGAIVVVDLQSGKARRLLADSKTTKAEPGTTITIDGKELIDQEKGKPPQFASDGIALDSKNAYLYYHALTGHTLYRIRIADLLNDKLSRKELDGKAENLGQTPLPDGMLEAPDGGIYLTDVEDGAIVRWDPATKKIERIIADKRLFWPDTMSWGPGGELYVTASQIENMPKYNGGKSTRTEPYKLFKVTGITPRP